MTLTSSVMVNMTQDRSRWNPGPKQIMAAVSMLYNLAEFQAVGCIVTCGNHPTTGTTDPNRLADRHLKFDTYVTVHHNTMSTSKHQGFASRKIVIESIGTKGGNLYSP